MSYVFFIVFILASFAMADESALGIVRIKNTQPAKYSLNTGKIIPNSQHTILKIKNISYDEKRPGRVALISTSGAVYDALLVFFEKIDRENTFPHKFEQYLYNNRGFVIDVSQSDLEFATNNFLSILKISAKNLIVRRPGQAHSMYLRGVICPMRAPSGFIPWADDIRASGNCL